MSRPSIVVIGAGLAGLGFAWHAAPHAHVTVLEQGEHPLAEASAQNAGMVRRLVTGARERALARRTHARLMTLPCRPGDDWHELAPFRATGAVLALEHDVHRLDAALADLRRFGITADELDAEALARRAPALAAARVARAVWLPDEGVCDAWSLGQGFLRGALRNGARLMLGTRVVSLLVRGGRVRGAVTDRGVIESDLVVIAAGAWSARLAASAGLRRAITPRARHLFRSTPHACAVDPHPWCWIDDAGLYLRPEAGGFLMSPCDETDDQPADGPGSRREPRDDARELLGEKLLRLLPALDDLAIAGGWIGHRTFTPSREPLIGPDPELAGLGWVAGLGGFGLSCGLAIAEDAARLLVPEATACEG